MGPSSIDPIFVYLISESCVAHPVQENTTTFYYCDYNNNVQSNFTSTSNLTYSLIPPETCVKGVWIITDQPSSNGKLEKVHQWHCINRTIVSILGELLVN